MLRRSKDGLYGKQEAAKFSQTDPKHNFKLPATVESDVYSSLVSGVGARSMVES
jgi:hypothetical protein